MELVVNFPFQKHPATGAIRPPFPPVDLALFDSFSCRALQPVVWLALTSQLGGEIEPVNVSMQTMCEHTHGFAPFSPSATSTLCLNVTVAYCKRARSGQRAAISTEIDSWGLQPYKASRSGYHNRRGDQVN